MQCGCFFGDLEKFVEKEIYDKYNIDPLHELCQSKLSAVIIDSDVFKDEVELILNGYEVMARGDKTYAVKKKPKYPTTYEECCSVLGMTFDYPNIGMVSSKEYCLYSRFIRLIRCRDAYWNIADNWEPDWNDNYQKKWIINFYQDKINLTNGTYDTAKEAFADLINKLNGKDYWESNPLGYTYEFELVK